MTCYSHPTPFSPVVQTQHFVNNYLTAYSQSLGANSDALTCPIGLMLLLSSLLGSGGPRANTATQISKALQIDPTASEEQQDAYASVLFRSVYDSLTNEVSEGMDRRTIRNVPIGVGAFLQYGYPLKPSFANAYTSLANASICVVDFGDGVSSMHEINEWAAEKSSGLIPNLIHSPSDIGHDTRLMLLNVLGFKDNWKATFDMTKKDTFCSNSNECREMEMMSINELMPYLVESTLGYAAIKKPLLNPRFSVIFVLPTNPFNLNAVDTMLYGTPSMKRLFEENAPQHMVTLVLPKFKLEINENLIPIATSMGIVDIFTTGLANLSGITEPEELYVNELKQGSVLHVDEYGVEAAAATYMSIAPISLHPHANFTVNQPFGCIIYDEDLDSPLFVARVVHPEQ